MNLEESDVKPAAYAPYRNPREYITAWTDRIWIKRAVGDLPLHYSPEVQVHNAYGETYGITDTIGNSIQKIAAFPNIAWIHDDVIWEKRGESGFVSSHRTLFTATHLGHGTYGLPTGKNVMNRIVALCNVHDNLITEEWVVRDEFSVLQGLGVDPYKVAARLAESTPVLRQPLKPPGDAKAFSMQIVDPVRAGVSGARPPHYDAACELVQEMIEQVWNQRRFHLVTKYFDETIACHTVRMRCILQHAPYQLDIMSMLAPFPDARMHIRDFAVHESPDLGLRVSALWVLRGTYSGTGAYGLVNNAPVAILGASHFELRDGKIIREYRIFDEVAVIAQIASFGNGWGAPDHQPACR
ncbi:hypothetical protein R75465_08053 [Paraburkholderia aspalathi]|uniref:nuclear transport factor 2 family protein n=1 Tax=Paraburkholderia aspalathi TaxID=1324617 RepID=UPI001B2F17EB|nr:ester cyclase [Paraburkholderia aspalathi]CAE6867383.1 hypothetical protein R75465_08053 [Paraburkholderia aspalathi]